MRTIERQFQPGAGFVAEATKRCVTQTALTLESVRAMTRPTITRREAAQVLEVDPRTVTAGIDAGTIPSIRIGRRVVIPREKFLKLFEVEND